MSAISTRVAYGRALVDLGSRDPKVFVLDADLAICTMTCYFAEANPERFFNAGIAESNMIGMAAGIATTGKTVFANSFAMFTAGRCYDQIRNSLGYTQLNVKVVGTHAGLSVGEDGATHQCIEDLSLMRTIPGMTVLCPADAHETTAMVAALLQHDGPAYVRLGRAAVADVTSTVPGYQFQIGRAATLRAGDDVTIIATGLMVQESLLAAQELARQGLQARVVDMHTIKPIDAAAIIAAARETGAIVTAEEHNVINGLGGAVAEVVSSSEFRVPVVRVGVEDKFGHSGPAREVMAAYGLTPERIVAASHESIGLRDASERRMAHAG